MELPPAEVAEIHLRMRNAAGVLRLPFRDQSWRGRSGTWSGSGTGSSIDFQDHRPYLPGDDPRYIDWQAYARTGHHIMKLYREEVSPLVDLALDISDSMFFEPGKARRVWELLFFCIESAMQAGSPPRSYFVHSAGADPHPVEELFGYRLPTQRPASGAPQLERVPWRSGALRILISDLLFAGDPQELLKPLRSQKGRALILSPFSNNESEPEWNGNVEFVDCETSSRRNQHVPDDLLDRYRLAYRRHFDHWRERARSFSVLLARVPSEEEFVSAMRMEALNCGAVEFVK